MNKRHSYICTKRYVQFHQCHTQDEHILELWAKLYKGLHYLIMMYPRMVPGVTTYKTTSLPTYTKQLSEFCQLRACGQCASLTPALGDVRFPRVLLPGMWYR